MVESLLNRLPTASYRTYREAVSLARLVEAEIMSPYQGILINTGTGNPTAPSIVALGERVSFTKQVGRRTIPAASTKI